MTAPARPSASDFLLTRMHPPHTPAHLQLGGGNFYGPSGISFFTQTKTVTSAWKPFEADSGSAAAQMTMPTPGKA